jgi:hypothetical protein
MYLQLTLYRGYNTRPFYMYIRITHFSILSQLSFTRGIIPVHSLCTFALHMYPYFHSLLPTGGIIPVHSVRTSTPQHAFMLLQFALPKGYDTRPFYVYIHTSHVSTSSQSALIRGYNTRPLHMYIHTPHIHITSSLLLWSQFTQPHQPQQSALSLSLSQSTWLHYPQSLQHNVIITTTVTIQHIYGT